MNTDGLDLLTKVCTKCGQCLPVSEFFKDKIKKYGLTGCCKSCVNDRSAAYRKANPEKIRAQQAAWAKANPEKEKALKRRQIEKLNDGYVRFLLVTRSNLSASAIPQEIVEAKRQQMQIKRVSREIKATLNQLK